MFVHTDVYEIKSVCVCGFVSVLYVCFVLILCVCLFEGYVVCPAMPVRD